MVVSTQIKNRLIQITKVQAIDAAFDDELACPDVSTI